MKMTGLLAVLHLLAVIIDLIDVCSGEVFSDVFSNVPHLNDMVCPDNQLIFNMTTTSFWTCLVLCMARGPICDGVGFNANTMSCYGCKGFNRISNCGSPLPYKNLTGTVNYMKTGYLVSGVAPVPDGSLSESSSYPPDIYFTAKSARLCKVETIDGIGAWSSFYLDQNQWVQVRFDQPIRVKGAAVWPRLSIANQFVKNYILWTSTNCVDFTSYKDADTDNPMVFDGAIDHVTGRDIVLPYPITALCIRINPTLWINWMSLKFDVIGHY